MFKSLLISSTALPALSEFTNYTSYTPPADPAAFYGFGRSRKRRDTKRKGARGYSDQKKRGRSERGQRKAEAREAAISNFIEIREDPSLRDPIYLNSSPAKRDADWKSAHAPAATKVTKKRRAKPQPRPASSYRAARREAAKEARRTGRIGIRAAA